MRTAVAHASRRRVLQPNAVLSTTATRTFYNQSDKLPLPMNWGIRVVPERSALVIERSYDRSGRFSRTLERGLHFLMPVVDSIAVS
jgi:hypothetical protein